MVLPPIDTREAAGKKVVSVVVVVSLSGVKRNKSLVAISYMGGRMVAWIDGWWTDIYACVKKVRIYAHFLGMKIDRSTQRLVGTKRNTYAYKKTLTYIRTETHSRCKHILTYIPTYLKGPGEAFHRFASVASTRCFDPSLDDIRSKKKRQAKFKTKSILLFKRQHILSRRGNPEGA